MEKLAKYLTNYIIRYGNAEEQSREIYEYGLQSMLETILSFSICAVLAQTIGMLGEGIVFFLIFIPLRSYAGGYHFDKYLLCLIFSCATFFAVLLIGKNLNLPLNMYLAIPLLLICVRLLYPVEHVNRPTDEEENKYFRKKLNFYLIIDFLLFILLFVLKQNSILAVAFLTLLLIVVTMVIGKISYKRRIKTFDL